MPTKQITATHEAGHALISLATPFRDYLSHVRVFQNASDWFGETHMDGRVRVQVDPHGVLEFAKGIAGPVTQLYFFPNSVDHALVDLIQQSGSLLRAARVVVQQGPKIATNWWPDLQAWLQLCEHVRIPGAGQDHLAVEAEIQTFLNLPETTKVVNEIRDRLIACDQIDRQGLLNIPVVHLPSLHFPTRLSKF